MTRRKSIIDVLPTIAEAFAAEIIDVSGCLLLNSVQARTSEHSAPPSDPVAFEATMNKRHLPDILGIRDDSETRSALVAVGRALIKTWAERIALRFPTRTVAFYLGGSDSVVIRFHERRSGHPDWINWDDRTFLRASALEIYELSAGGLARVV